MPVTQGTHRRGYLVGVADKVAWQFLGLPYRWGGDDPMQGFDCSGFVIEILKSVGLLPRGVDTTAHGLWQMFSNREVVVPIPGCLVFWYRSDGRIVHVEYCIDGEFSIGASGGGSATVTVEDAIQRNAYIKVRPFRSRLHIKGFVDPFKEVVNDGSIET